MKTSKKILLIEDDQDDQCFFKEALSKINEASLFGLANNGKEALKQLNESEVLPDIIFSDINMPVMDGVECFMKILNSPRISKIPMFFLTNDMTKIDKMLQLGARAFINKPIDEKTLCIKIRQALRREFSENPYKETGFVRQYSLQ